MDGDAVAASDIAGRTVANEIDRAEHEAEKTDTILAGLAIRYIRNRSTTGVVVLTDDQPAGKGIENAVRAQGLHGYDHGLRLDGHHRRRSRRLDATDLAE